MPRYRAYFSPYFASEQYQESNERRVEKAIENNFKSIYYLITKVWRHHPTSTIDDVNIEDTKILDRHKDE